MKLASGRTTPSFNFKQTFAQLNGIEILFLTEDAVKHIVILLKMKMIMVIHYMVSDVNGIVTHMVTLFKKLHGNGCSFPLKSSYMIVVLHFTPDI